MGTAYQGHSQAYENTAYQAHSQGYGKLLPYLPRHLGEEARLPLFTLHMPFWTKEMETGIWDFKGKVGNSQVDEKEQICGKHSCWATQR